MKFMVKIKEPLIIEKSQAFSNLAIRAANG
jgi:hypothetical protein